MHRAITLPAAVFMLLLTSGDFSHAQNLAPQVAPSPTASKSGAVPQAQVWVPPPTPDLQTTMEQRRKKLSVALNGWIGGDINDLIIKWSAPSSEYKMPNGNIIYTWQDTGVLPAPDGGEIMISCKISIYTDLRGRIFNWQWGGNSCLFRTIQE